MLQEPIGIPLRREVEYKIQLLSDSPLLNIGMYKKFVIEASEVKNQLQQILEQGVI